MTDSARAIVVMDTVLPLGVTKARGFTGLFMTVITFLVGCDVI